MKRTPLFDCNSAAVARRSPKLISWQDPPLVLRCSSGDAAGWGLLPGLRYEAVNRDWEMSDFEHRLHGWPQARRFVVARRFLPEEGAQTTLFTLGRYVYRAWVTNMSLTPAGIWHFYDGRAGMEPRIGELREDCALRKIPTASFAANALYLEIIRLTYNLVTAFQRNCL